jgi:hypothetical protein
MTVQFLVGRNLGIFLAVLWLLPGWGTPAAHAEDLAKVRTTLSVKGKVWVGQRLTLVIELLSPGYFAGSPVFDLPSVAGVLLFQPEERPVLSSETLDKTSYTVQRHELAVFSQRAGQVTIPSFEVRFATRQGSAAPVEQRLPTEAVSFDANIPPGAEGLATLISARDLKATETWRPKPGSAKAGDAFTRTITFSASEVPAMAFPQFPVTNIAGLGVYPKAPRLLDKSERGTTTGQRQDAFVYVCKQAGQYVIPAARFTWWDLDAQRLRTINFPAQTFRVAANPVATPAAAGGKGKRNWRAELGKGGLVAAIVVAVAGFGWWTRRRWTRWWWQAIDFWRPVHLAPLNPPPLTRTANLKPGSQRAKKRGISLKS